MRWPRTRLIELAAVGLLVSACGPASPASAPTAAPASAAQSSGPSAQASSPTLAPTVAAAQPSATSTPAASGPLVEAALGNLSKTLHPYPDSASYSQPWVDAAGLIWGGADGGGGLLAFDWDALDYRPAMATALPRVSSNGTTFTFTLRDNLKWSDGSALTVDDFQFAYDQASREENHYVQLDLLQDIATFRTPDAHSIEVTLKAAKPRDVAHGVFVPVGTYFVGQARVPQVEILANQQPTVAFESLKNGRANWVHALPPAQYQEAKGNPDVDVKEWPAANAAYRTVEFNLTRPFLSDKRVRQALAYAVSRADLMDVAEQGLAVPQYSFVQPTNTRWVNNAVDKYELDLGKARRVLQDAGYQVSNGLLVGKDGQAIKLQVLYPSSSGPRGKIAAYMQQQYKQLGIEVEVKSLDFNAYTEQVQNRHDFDISLAAYGGGSLDPDLGPRAQLISSGQQNVTGYANPQVDDLFKLAANELDDAKRKQMYDQIQTLVNADLPSHYLYALKAIDAFSRKVQGVTPRNGDRLDYNDAVLSWSVTQ
ncbi:MAG: ABC transporter substrate-binding protein [Chloroflexi bacterium]|nr:ABC transporter substrate-binding protein [Chloroflexota bacterium]